MSDGLTYTAPVRFDELFDHEMAFSPRPEQRPAEQAATPSPGSGEAPPAAPEGNAAVRASFPRGGGVYLLTDGEDRLVQLAAAADLRRALRARLLEPAAADGEKVGDEPADNKPLVLSPRRRANLGEIVRQIRWRTTHSMFEIAYEYHRIARLLMPDVYLDNVAFGPSYFVHVDSQAEAPHFVVGKTLRSPPGVDLGPLATHGDAVRLVQILEDAFDLCRYPHILEQAPHGQPCAYFEMGKCPAPCDGSIPMSQYRETVTTALAFASGDRQRHYAAWEAAMHGASRALEFERAAALKQHLERSRGIEHSAFRLARPMSEFHYLVVQRGGGRTRVKPFFVRAGRITPGPAVRLRDIDEAAARWIDELRQPPGGAPGDSPPRTQDAQETSEQVWLVSHFLFKQDAPGLFVHATAFGEPRLLADRIRARFACRDRGAA